MYPFVFQRIQRKPDKFGSNPVIMVFFRDCRVINKSPAPVMTRKDRANDYAAALRDKAAGGISQKIPLDSLTGIVRRM